MKYFPVFFLILAACTQAVSPPAPVEPVPSAKQLAWHDLEYYAFVHFNMNTFSDMEWGMGDESPSEFNPSALDTRQWAKVAKEAGMKGIIITAKHHDGFCLWPSAYTEHSVKNSPWRDGKGDLIRELSDACKEYGLKFGIYYSPWDRNHADYGKPEYITYMRSQLTELLTDYGDIFEVWFDGANGGDGYYGGANEVRTVDKLTYYEWEKTYNLVRDLQPGAVMFSDGGPDVRWVGNEHGFAYETTWGNLMRDSVYAGMPDYPERFASGQENGTHWVPAESDVSIRPGWYYHEYEDHKVKTLPQLLEIYYKSIGQNSSLLINFPVDKRGLIHEKDVEQVIKLADKIKEDFAVDLAKTAKVTASNERGKGFEVENVTDDKKDSYWATEDGVIESSIVLTLAEPTLINRFVAQEFIPLGQRIKKFTLEVETVNGWEEIYQGTTVGIKRILRFDDILAKQVRFSITDAKASPTVSKIGIFYAPKLVTVPEFNRSISGEVTFSVPEKGIKIYYTIDGSEPNESSTKYENPILVSEPAEFKAISFDRESKKESEVLVRNLDIPKSNWKVENQDENAAKVIDEDPQTFWKSGQNEVVIDLGELITISGFTYWPPQNRFMSGVISKYIFEGSIDGKTWGGLTSGEFSNIKNNPIEQVMRFAPSQVRFVRLKSFQTTDGQAAVFAEVGVITNY